MKVTLLGIVMFVKLLQFIKAPPAIISILWGIVYVPEYERGKYANTYALNIGLERLLQPSKAHHPMSVTLLGSEMLVNLEQPKKAIPPIAVTLLGIDMFFRLVHLSKAL